MEKENIRDFEIKKYIGSGKTANCFLSTNDELLKIYKKILVWPCYKSHYTFEEIEKLGILNSNLIIAPLTILNKNDKLIGYKTKYVDAQTIKKLNNNVKIIDILNAYKNLIKEVEVISNQYYFSLIDIHCKNILYNGNFYIIDLDLGIFSKINPLELNISKVSTIIEYAMFKEDYYQLLFKDTKLALMSNSLFREYGTFEDFCERLFEIFDSNEITVLDLQKKQTKLLKR